MKKKIILGAGGTGGHMFPAASTAHFFASEGYEIILLTDDRGKRFAKDFAGYKIIVLPSSNIRQGSFLERLGGVFNLINGVLQAIHIIQTEKPSAVIGFGGYPSFPTGIGAAITRFPLFLHEQNAIIGRTNKFLKLFARKILTSFKKTIGIEGHSKAVFTGNPVRVQILNQIEKSLEEKNKDKFHILITGGSQGARIFTDIIPVAFGFLSEEKRKQITVLHQTRPADVSETQELYNNQKVNATVVPFIEDMGEEMVKADLVICRSGASTLAELSTLGRVAFFVPLPTAADDQQTINAEYFVRHGAGKMIPQKDVSPMLIASMIAEYMRFPEKLEKAQSVARKLGKTNATEEIFQIITENIKSKSVEK